ncbi:MAG: hypothetical protein E6K94_04240 [Thaumarchaeota archaeon]|nr:MAG: hypothetical protein E6L01_04700 [Nitrososphaerota archaeon]TLX91235.1 MAG: hypothetical protein E6K94_04240 [Nitrososphaerota archaeon]
MKQKKSHIAIFDTFKTKKNKFTGEAKRQRGIIIHLAMEKNPELRTRTSIAHAIAKNNGILWQNIYSGIFKDLDEVLIPSGVVKEGGRLPLRRGPKALQLEGVPFYELTETGILVASSIEELGDSRIKILESYFNGMNVSVSNNEIMKKSILLLLKTIPSFVIKIISAYIYAYSTGTIDNITPITIDRFRSVIKEQISIEREFIESYDVLSQNQKQLLKDFFKIVS